MYKTQIIGRAAFKNTRKRAHTNDMTSNSSSSEELDTVSPSLVFTVKPKSKLLNELKSIRSVEEQLK